MRLLPMLTIVAMAGLAAAQSKAQAAAQPLGVTLSRGGDDRATLDLVDAIHAAAPAAGVTLMPPAQAGGVPVLLGMPKDVGRHRFTVAVGQPRGKPHVVRTLRFSGFDVRCDRRRQDLCAGKILAKLDRQFQRRG